MGTQPLPKNGRSTPSQFSAHLYCGQTAGCIKMPLGMEVGLSPVDCVRWVPAPKKGVEPSNFRPMSIAAKWLHGGRPRPRQHCVRWGPSSQNPKGGGAPSPNFGPCLLWPNGSMYQDSTWHGGEPWFSAHCARWGPSYPPQKEGAPNFWPISVVAKRLYASRCYSVWR